MEEDSREIMRQVFKGHSNDLGLYTKKCLLSALSKEMASSAPYLGSHLVTALISGPRTGSRETEVYKSRHSNGPGGWRWQMCQEANTYSYCFKIKAKTVNEAPKKIHTKVISGIKGTGEFRQLE